MAHRLFSLPSKNAELNEFETKLVELVSANWPAFPLEIAEHLGEKISSREQARKASSKYSYHLRKLVEKRLLLSKKAGNASVFWPLVVEKYRVVHDILKE